jgi:hypothetical protein
MWVGESVTKNGAQRSPNDRSNSALGRCFANSEASAIGSNRRVLTQPSLRAVMFDPEFLQHLLPLL